MANRKRLAATTLAVALMLGAGTVVATGVDAKGGGRPQGGAGHVEASHTPGASHVDPSGTPGAGHGDGTPGAGKRGRDGDRRHGGTVTPTPTVVGVSG